MFTDSTERFIASFQWAMSRVLIEAIIMQFGGEAKFVETFRDVFFTPGGLAVFDGFDSAEVRAAFHAEHASSLADYADFETEINCAKSVDEMLRKKELLDDSYKGGSERTGAMSAALCAMFPNLTPEPVSSEMASALVLLAGKAVLRAYSKFEEREMDAAHALAAKNPQPCKYDGIDNDLVAVGQIVIL